MNDKLLILTDRGLLKAYKWTTTARGTPHLDLLEQTVLEEAHHRLVDQVTDLAGRRGSPTLRGGGSPLVDSHNLELEVQRRVFKEIGEQMVRLAQAHPELDLWFAAPKEINHQILEELPPKVRGRVRVNLSRDLVKVGKQDLFESFGPAAQAQPQESSMARSE